MTAPQHDGGAMAEAGKQRIPDSAWQHRVRGIRIYKGRLGFTGPSGGGGLRWMSRWMQSVVVFVWNSIYSFMGWLIRFGRRDM